MEQQSTQRRRTASVWRCRDLPFSNREPQFSVSGFQHEQICTSNHCTHLISHCACPVIHCRISKQNLRPRHTKLSLIIRQPMGKLYQTPLLPAEKDQVTRNRSIGRPNFFSACSEESRLWSAERQLQTALQTPAPPIATPLLSTNQVLVSSANHNPTFPLLCFVYTVISPLWKAERAWASYKYAF